MTQKTINSAILGGCLALGLIGLGFVLKDGLLAFKSMERSVLVKGLAEQEVAADTVIWPIQFSDTGNKLAPLVEQIQTKNQAVIAYLKLHGFEDSDITVAAPAIIDKLADQYSSNQAGQFRYIVRSTLTVYSHDSEKVGNALAQISELAKQDIAIAGQNYESRVQYLFTGLNELKPQMIQIATEQAREVAEKFASDSKSQLGKIKSARQGQFTIEDRDSNTPQIKNVRVVSTVEYYLSD
ncbi:SIMPL domain-containing protein [Pseudoalteromonas tunicata]|uniref:Periplasmic protein n=1 Tax=Pseudoalteromonas tunicata D2 TaxID=87626 RepID=A4C9D4_9GAMM|nr:SIMPL domain-containing protein [Pseudoalteromonas tunicata]ATC93703.1 hypothetical protein PTUN_a1002 [Pseudoalteromonas tunicata]AXT29531.1 SIMPL domain-containing protein [Pseudoalteromonas tunicata]EAR29199.1 hypothetical protein PTD2_09144 [Pseudoalteromonas tunicata D2]MDP4983565.1 SIMPL domain-containing protein [Pseudoalteromonas tunicata]MDP5211913.1 SIMPL domain-containing protein [Pseudoalteromonas tunicata]